MKNVCLYEYYIAVYHHVDAIATSDTAHDASVHTYIHINQLAPSVSHTG